MKPVVHIVADKVGVAGSLVPTLSCTMCLPGAASIGAAIGLGFLSRWEPLFLKILPLFAALALVANGLGWLTHRQWRRTVLGMIGPILALIGRYAFTGGALHPETARGILYVGLAVMMVFAVWDLISPGNRRCAPDGCDQPADERASTNR